MTKLRHRPSTASLALSCLFLFCLPLPEAQAQSHSILCKDGYGSFDAESMTGVKVHVGAARPGGGLAMRSCAAALTWKNRELVVSGGASQIDLDAFGVDLGFGSPVAGFQLKTSDVGRCMQYRIYSLAEPPHLLRTIDGGEFYSAADTDLDGRVELWTTDAAAVDGFEKLSLAELDSAPTLVLRFVHGKLQDASAEFRSYFDHEIAARRAHLDRQDLDDFKASDGKLAAAPTPAEADRLHRLRSAKIAILEIVWSYLYSGRQQEAWRSLAEMWPPSDVDRIRTALAKVHDTGIRRFVDTASTAPSQDKKKRKTQVFRLDAPSVQGRRSGFIPPRSIIIDLPPTSGAWQTPLPATELLFDLLIDEAGKVRSAEPAGNQPSITPEEIIHALSWKFIPAFSNGKPVASRLRIAISAKQ